MNWYSWWVPMGWGLLFTVIGVGLAWGTWEAIAELVD